MKELGLYIHIPFCAQKCNYCDFISFSNKEDFIEKYVNTLIKEIQTESNKKYVINTIYIGGGTPSYIESKHIEKILNVVKQNYNIKPDVEITIEVNPGTINKEKIEQYKKIGINRISIGAQSTNDKLLNLIGRIHTYDKFLEAYNIIKKIGFTNINVDLMLGLPKQTMEDLNDSLNKIISLRPTHISVYSLIVEEETKIYRQIQSGELQLPPEEVERKMYWFVKNKLEQNEYIHYEISNFCKKGFESKHNLNCWNQNEYLGLGLSAHSYINNKRYSNTEDFKEYIKDYKKYQEIHEIQNEEDKQKEFMLLGLRKIDGVNIEQFKNIFLSNPIYLYKDILEKLSKKGLIKLDLNNIRLTKKGIDLANLVWQEFI